MAYGHPIELRARVMAALDQGMSPTQLAEIFTVSSKTIYNWIKLRKETGELRCKLPPTVRSTRKLTPENLTEYLEKHPDHYLREIAEAFGVKQQSVDDALKKFRITRKKNHALQRARREQKERFSKRNRDPQPR